MIEIIRKPDKTADEVRDLLLDHCESLEEGFEIMDTDLALDADTSVDFLVRDAAGKAVVVVVAAKEDEDTVLVHRILQIVQKFGRNRFFLQKIYSDPQLDFSITPRIFLLLDRMTDDFAECLALMKGLDVVPCEYSFLRLEDRDYFTIARKGEDEPVRAVRVNAAAEEAAPAPGKPVKITPPQAEAAPAAKKQAPVPSAEESAQKEEKNGERFFADARKKILKISVDINESADGNLTRFKINNETLASLALKDGICYIFLGSKTDKAIKVATERLLNEALNQVYKRYFNLFNSKTAQELSGI